jgi:hypothetical protein
MKEDNDISLAATTKFQFNGNCGCCKKPGHMAKECRKKKYDQCTDLRPCKHCGGKHMDSKCWELPQNESSRPTNWKSKKGHETANVAKDGKSGPKVELLLSSVDQELLTFPNNQEILMSPTIWIGDTTATVHMTPHEDGMINARKIRGGITVGNCEVMVAKKTGDILCQICDKYGRPLQNGIITEVALTKSSPFSLFSVTKMMKQGWKLGGDKTIGITLTKGTNVLSFDIPIETAKGVVYGMCITRSEIAAPAMVTTMNVERAHSLLGHQSEELTRRSAQHLGWTLTKGSLKPCLPCTIGKAKQKNTVKNSDHQLSSKPSERIFTDIASLQPKDGETTRTPHWCIKVDGKTQFKTSTFHKQKNDMVEPSCELFFRWKQGGNPVSFIRCDNAGENMNLQKRVNNVDWKLNIAFEFTPRDTPQHNHLAELGLESIANKGRALMSAANVPLKIRYKVWTMAFKHATDLDGLIVITIGRRTATRYEHWCGQLPKWVNHLRTWEKQEL